MGSVRGIAKRSSVAAVVALVALAACVLLVAAPAPAQAASFSDVGATDWFAPAVQTLSNAGIVAGRADGTFGPNDPVTRAEYAVLLVRCLNLPAGTAHPFTDFPTGVWFEPAVAAVYQTGLAGGVSPTQFAPYETISRQQAVTMTVRALAYRLKLHPIDGLDLTLPAADVPLWLQGLPDRDLIAGAHLPAAANACRLQLLNGQLDRGFRPYDPMTRAETAALLYLALFQTPQPLSEPPAPVPATGSQPPAGQRTSGQPGSEPAGDTGAQPAYRPLSSGSQGANVLWLEQRLTTLSYRPGPVDGVYDARTRQAVIAFQKSEGLSREGTVNAATWSRLLTAGLPTARMSRSGVWIEVNLARQVLLYVVNGTVTRTLPTSTGATFTYHSAPYVVQRKDIPDGPRYRALYLSSGNVLAIHGYSSVPTYPASHGCIRLTKWDMDDLRASDDTNPMIPDGTLVYIY